ncbi:hypothetical protein DERP_001388 [Dermatophagoides pteronyssinus]|uniref:Transmembrane protein n=1 Tax=Dermatophagoides pteronyssinus TaxID=6956 RepID=A0ABQ8JES3_DERPT|nr:hypothetical protein DERP_001388 [Dermatophagoides pteronyssinus]
MYHSDGGSEGDKIFLFFKDDTVGVIIVVLIIMLLHHDRSCCMTNWAHGCSSLFLVIRTTYGND